MDVFPAKEADYEEWMALVHRVKDNFPGLEDAQVWAEHGITVMKNIRRATALCAKENGQICGILLFSPAQMRLSFLAVAPESRRKGCARALTQAMLKRMPSEGDITVTTFREGDPLGEDARKTYFALGFEEGAYTEAFGHATQTFVYRR